MRGSTRRLHALLMGAGLLVALLSLRYGAIEASWLDLAEVFSADPGPLAAAIIELRLPRTLCAAVIGIYLGVSGLVFQTVLRNPLADPTLFGISSGASLAVITAMGVASALSPSELSQGAASSVLPMPLVPPIALGGGLAATLLVVWPSWRDGLSPLRLVLFGAVLAVALNGVVMVLVLSLSEARTELAVLWLAGSLYARDLANLWPALPWGVAGLGVIALALPWLSGLRFDADTARGFGVSTALAVPTLLAAAAGLAASAVSIAGPVGFVGLLVPHIARLLYGPNLSDLLIGSVLIGGLLVMTSDLLGRIIAPPIEIPVGIVTSLIGAPIFALLIRRQIIRAVS